MAFTHPENVIINQAAPFTGRLVDVQLSGASKAYVDQDGNVFINGSVGIGTASPAAKLHVVGNTYLMGGSVGINTTNPQERLDVRQTGAGGTVGVRIGGDGASAASYLDIAASDALSNQMLWRLRPTSTAANQSRFDILNITQGQARISIDNAGNVGIGTQTPTAKLEVAGDIKASGNISAGGSGDVAVSAGRRLYFNGLGGTRYILDDPTQNCIDVAGNLSAGGSFTVNGGFRSSSHPLSQNGVSIHGGGATAPGLIQSNWNLELLRFLDVNDPNNPPYIYLGLDANDLLYMFYQYRQDQVEMGTWGGVQTFYRITGKPVSWGYGFRPMRVWSKNTQLDPAGVLVGRKGVVNSLSFLRVKHVDPTAPGSGDPVFAYPDTYTNNRPYKAGVELGGIGYDPADETVQIYRSGINNDGPDLIFKDVNNSAGVRLSQFVRGVTDKMRILTGRDSTDTSGSKTLTFSGLASTPILIVSSVHTDNAYIVSGEAVSSTAATVTSRNTNNQLLGPITFNWIAIGLSA